MTFIKYLGGKTQLLPQLSDLFPNFKNIKGYAEPFIGGGSVFFYLENCGYLKNKPIYLSDINENLINTYLIVRDNVSKLIPILKKYENEHTEQMYYDVRDNFHKKTVDTIERAAQFIYINKTCFNGVWNTDKNGICNTSIGHKEKHSIFNEKEIRRCSEALKNAQIGVMSYEHVIEIPDIKNYMIYLDPPYDNISDEDSKSYVKYNTDGFKIKRDLLLDTFRKLDELGCKVMMSNAYTPWIQAQFKDYKIKTIKAKRICAGDAEKRIPVNEVVITNYKPTKKQLKIEDY